MSIEIQESTAKPETDGQSSVLIRQTCYRFLCAFQKKLKKAVPINVYNNRHEGWRVAS